MREYDDERPFLLVVGFNRPHGPFIVPDEYFERFPIESTKQSIKFKEGGISETVSFFAMFDTHNEYYQSLVFYLINHAVRSNPNPIEFLTLQLF